MPSKIEELKNKIYGALGDPQAPWYGSDLVSWVGDYIEEVEAKTKELEELLIEYGRHQPGCSAQYDKKYPCRCGWDRERKQALSG